MGRRWQSGQQERDRDWGPGWAGGGLSGSIALGQCPLMGLGAIADPLGLGAIAWRFDRPRTQVLPTEQRSIASGSELGSIAGRAQTAPS